MSKTPTMEELDLWIKNCLIVLAGLMPEIPIHLLSNSLPRKPENYPKSFDWWLYQTFAADCPGRLEFVGILLSFVDDVQCSPYKLLFGLPDDEVLQVSDDFVLEDLKDVFSGHLSWLIVAQTNLQKKVTLPKVWVCPECESREVTTEHHQMFMVNTGEHYCHSMKPQDQDSPATCLTCSWKGERHQLIQKTAEKPASTKRKGRVRTQDPGGQ